MLNYHHLHYFWTVVREGSVAAAARKLHLGRPTISTQLKTLETYLGQPLFERRGRSLEPTAFGRLVADYAEDIFRTGSELMDVVQGHAGGWSRRLRVGVVDVMPKVVAYRLLLPGLDLEQDARLEVREGHAEELLAELALHHLDLLLSDAPRSDSVDVRAFNHKVGESTATLFAAPALARKLARGFPHSLNDTPMLMPARGSALRSAIEIWLSAEDLHPQVVAEFQDSALLMVFAREARGAFLAPTIVAEEIQAQYRVRAVAEVPAVRETFYAISTERRIRHPSVAHLVAEARDLFAS